jgi:uncharacterized protein GlcG (DUF336 family)
MRLQKHARFAFPHDVKNNFAASKFAFAAGAIFAALQLSASAYSTFTPVRLSKSDVETIVAQAATEAERIVPEAIIAVTDRDGFVLALWDVAKHLPKPFPAFDAIPFPPLATDPDRARKLRTVKLYALVAGAVTRASTAAFLSSDQNAFTSRTAGYIIQQHFPVGVRNTGNGPLVGVGFSSLFYTDVNRVKLIPPGFDGAALVSPTLSPGVRAPLFPLTSLNDSPGGVPLYKQGHLVGGIGVTGDGDPSDLTPAGAILFKETQNNSTPGFKNGSDKDELVALAGQTNFRPSGDIVATKVLINGIRIPYVFPALPDIEDVSDPKPFGSVGRSIDVPLVAVPAPGGELAVLVPPQSKTHGAVVYPSPVPAPLPVGTVASGSPQASPAVYPYEETTLGSYEGEIRFPFRADPLATDPNPKRHEINGKGRLTEAEVRSIITHVAQRANITRAGIRLPVGTPMKIFISVVNNPDKPGEVPDILGVFRTGEATVFSWDVSVQKARTALFFSNNQLAMSARSVGFLAQRFFPPGIDGTIHGPYFGFQEAVTLRTSVKPGVAFPSFFPGNPNVPNGITIFPGGFPLYRSGQLIGAVGVSGDGVDQDDIATISGTIDFQAKPSIRADSFTYHGARLPYVKFPRDPVR